MLHGMAASMEPLRSDADFVGLTALLLLDGNVATIEPLRPPRFILVTGGSWLRSTGAKLRSVGVQLAERLWLQSPPTSFSLPRRTTT